MTNTADLRAAAEAATYQPSLGERLQFSELASPDRILALLSELERKTAALEAVAAYPFQPELPEGRAVLLRVREVLRNDA